MTNDGPPPVKRGCVCFQPTILTWHSVKKVKYSSPSFCTLNRPHLSDSFHRHSPLVSIRWYDDRGRMISTKWTGRCTKETIMEEKFGCLNEPQPLLRFFFFEWLVFHRSFLDCWGHIVLAVVVWLAPAWWKKPGIKTYEPTKRKQMQYTIFGSKQDWNNGLFHNPYNHKSVHLWIYFLPSTSWKIGICY